MAAVNSVNPVFAKFALVGKNDSVTLGDAAQEGAKILEHVMIPGGAKMGFNDEGNVPFHDACDDIPWGDAILCSATVDPDTGAITLDQLDAQHIHGVCYGTTIQDCSVQLNAGLSVSGDMDASLSVAVGDGAEFVVAVRSNCQWDETSGQLVPVGEAMSDDTPAAPQVLAISSAIDPHVINLGKTEDVDNVLTFIIPKATGGFTFTVRGTLAKAPFVRRVSDYTSMHDRVMSFPTSQAIINAKVEG